MLLIDGKKIGKFARFDISLENEGRIIEFVHGGVRAVFT